MWDDSTTLDNRKCAKKYNYTLNYNNGVIKLLLTRGDLI